DGNTVNVNLPDELSPDQLTPEFLRELAEQKASGPTELGKDPDSGEPVLLLNGRYGWFVQLGEASDDNPKPKRQSLPRGMSPDDVDLDLALKLLSLPRDLGAHPEGGRVITTYGPHGPYVAHAKEDGKRDFRSLPKEKTPLDVTFDEAMELLRQPKKRGRAAAQALREIGPHPADGEPIQLLDGRYGPYVKHGKINASLPKDQDPDKLTLEQAVELLAAKAAKGSSKRGKGRSRSKKKGS
ncbi:MAG: DNA topoisomerase I, partial [Candidatus Dadabacteria bacterium]